MWRYRQAPNEVLSHSHGPLSQRFEEELMGGNSWCGSAGGVKLQRSALGVVASKVDPFERKQGGTSEAVERAWDRDVRATVHPCFTALMHHL